MDNGRNNKGQFAHGNNGRPKGVKSERVQIWNEIGEWFKTEGITTYKEKVINMLESEDTKEIELGLKHFETMINYFKPKLQSTELKADQNNKITVVYESEPIPTASSAGEDQE